MELGAGLFLAAAAAAGFGVTYLCGVALNLEERIAFGVVLGAMTAAASTFLFSLAVRDVTVATDLLGLAISIAIGVVGAVLARGRLAGDLADARRRWMGPLRSANHPWPLAAVVLVCAAWTVHFLHQAYVYTPEGLFAGYVNIWGDWAAHLSFAGSFAYGHNFPPEYSIDPGHRLGYPFMIDYLAADLVPLGFSLTSSLVATTATLGLAFPAVLYLGAQRFAGGRAAAAISVFVFLLSGGLGFVYLIGDIQQGGLGVLAHLPREYTLNRDLNFQWLNPVLAYLVPQRSTLFGFSLALIVLVVIWLAVREKLGWQPFLFGGLVAGIMPVFHVHAYGTVVALSAFWAVFNRRKEWLAFFVPAVLIGVPILVWMWPAANTSVCGDLLSIDGYCIEPGWLSFTDLQKDALSWIGWDFAWFWIKNTSVFIPLLLAAYALPRWFPTGFTTWYAPMWLWFAVPSLVILQPWDWDNTKFFIYWALLGSVLVGGVLAGMLRRGGFTAAAACVLLVLLGLSGALDLYRASDFSVSSVQFTDAGGLNVAAWVRANTSPTAMFAVANQHNNPIPTLTGRREVAGYPGWLWTYGLSDYAQKGSDEKLILDGASSTPNLVRKYRVDYVMIGPQELALGASRAYWDEHGTLVFDNGEYAVYRVKAAG
ncbi:MAG TPA: hypothetical protein VMW11_04780 [Candidatus Dormibacteraeota bacterium]|nr:hypothetical protein [Candidatus Dormibacteraeota bacterium]